MLESTKNMIYAGDRKFIQVSVCQKIIDIEHGLRKKDAVFFAPRGRG